MVYQFLQAGDGILSVMSLGVCHYLDWIRQRQVAAMRKGLLDNALRVGCTHARLNIVWSLRVAVLFGNGYLRIQKQA
jgi:hypothetical protein